ncbi:probable LRR receptor-like serine/threonine-protein kinase At2g23950 isoform X3 [Cryptomeria japonica]|uniref:probable LRR receptor-like serine/threonine-protein kinase At2g23950 isoform X2 n=1 Tax=Cryptomeria japonica TaxID=3369 RepID=UPI0025AC3A0E|nr:probable LRR receptor-like serine/threonine-protein kinase At2g23950 isoform X2 [Cryptomeria japonica]XP_057858732.1 probable LRR receptor-like serine/threonine-protein kinase At2g23950 isoform X3 [Cryptomeria japonica]
MEVNRKRCFVILIALFSIYVNSNLIQATLEGDALQIIKEMFHAEVNWTGNDPCQGWEGVNCSDNHVVDLDLSEKNLRGKLPAEIGLLSNLNSLILTSNLIEGNIPNEIANLTNLHTLRLDNTHLSGTIPSDIQQLSSLEYLYLGNCSFSGPIPTEIGKLNNLKVLTLWGNFINTTLLVELSKLTNLEILNLHDSHMYGSLPPEFGSLKKMKNLSLQANLITGTVPDSWISMVNIQHLNLFDNRLSGPIPTWLSRFSTRINLGCNYFFGPSPTGFPENTFTGNCLDSDLDGHVKCLGSSSCVSFYSQPENAQSGYRLKRHKRSHTKVALVASISCILLLVILVVTFYGLKRKIKQARNSELHIVGTQSSTDTLGSDNIEPWEVPNGIRRFSLDEILKATQGFNKTNEIGSGGFGKVYKGYLDNGCTVAMKRASPSSIQGCKEFRNEMVVLSRLHHRCLVKLEGFCEEGREQILVYEFMKNGNLSNLIANQQIRESLSWRKRIEIAVAIAQGLDYLHSFVDPPIIHRDVKPSNILLDEHFNAKLSDFGISRTTPDIINTHVSTAPAGTLGYVDPQYFLRRHLAPSSDVYSYGVVLLELITGQKAIDHNHLEETNLVEWHLLDYEPVSFDPFGNQVKIKFQEDNLESVIDRHILHDNLLQECLPVIELALKCTAFDSFSRPSMKDVVQILEPLLKNHSTCHQENSPPIVETTASGLTSSTQSSTSQATFTSTNITGH